jgi:hypothetical protein
VDTAPAAERVRSATRRKSVPLTARDLADLELIRRSPAARAALAVDEDASEAAILHGILALGIGEALKVALDVGYDQLAVSYEQDPDEAAARDAMRERRRVRSDRVDEG